MNTSRPLKHIKKADLAPIWARLDIPLERIARRLGVTRQGLTYKAKILGLPSRAGNYEPQKKTPDSDFVKMWNAGVNTTELAKHFGYSTRSAVSHRRAVLGLSARRRTIGSASQGGWIDTISLTQFFEGELAAKMKREAANV